MNKNDKTESVLKTKKLDERKVKALIVDDETDICYLLSNILKQKNIQTAFAGTLAEADRMLQSTPGYFYYIFLDNHLPDGLGINQIKRWKEKFPFLHVIMITAHDSYEERKKASKDGADDFISKPFSRDIIFNSIVQTLA